MHTIANRVRIFASQDGVNKNALFTGYSFIHFLFGVYVAILMKYFKYSDIQIVLVVSVVHLLYEAKDYHLAYNTNWRDSDGTYDNSFLNSIMDQVCATLGMASVLWLPRGTVRALNRHVLGYSIAYIFIVTLFAYMYVVHKLVG
jgi:hypothetical protein